MDVFLSKFKICIYQINFCYGPEDGRSWRMMRGGHVVSSYFVYNIQILHVPAKYACRVRHAPGLPRRQQKTAISKMPTIDSDPKSLRAGVWNFKRSRDTRGSRAWAAKGETCVNEVPVPAPAAGWASRTGVVNWLEKCPILWGAVRDSMHDHKKIFSGKYCWRFRACFCIGCFLW